MFTSLYKESSHKLWAAGENIYQLIQAVEPQIIGSWGKYLPVYTRSRATKYRRLGKIFTSLYKESSHKL